MRVLMIARSTLFSSPGGDTTQVEMTAKYLRVLGVDADIKLSNEDMDYSSYDLLHFFNIIRPDDILPHIKKTNLPFVISTIFVDYWEYDKNNRTGLMGFISNALGRNQLEYLKAIARSVKNGEKVKSRYYILNGHKKSIEYSTKKAAVLLPNSHSEYNRFVKEYGVKQRYRKVVNAIDSALFNDDVLPHPDYNGHVLCVGRIEGRKNQLNLIKALKDTGLQLTIIGKPSPNHIAYYDECKAVAGGMDNVKFINHISHDELPSIYKAAKVHVLPSWFETTGLSSLEAGAMGCNLVVTRKGDTEEYFGDKAFYCEPDDVASIKEAVLNAYRAPGNTELKNLILQQYTWQKTAEATVDAYQVILNNQPEKSFQIHQECV